MNMLGILCFLTLSLQVFYQEVHGDVYLHVPKGSNDRLNSARRNRRNANRVFDSQNNAKGGYNAAETTKDASTDWYYMKYFMSGPTPSAKTILQIEWTNQHGCGDGDLNCNIVLQYKCHPDSVESNFERMRNGKIENTPFYRKNKYSFWKLKDRNEKRQVRPNRVLNEPWEWYDKCAKRERNKGLFTADQNLKSDASISTRQNPNGNRHGYECPEERDYYPYFHPTDWKDIAVLANKKEDCDYYQKESFNVKPKGECLERYPMIGKKRKQQGLYWRHDTTYNNEDDCTKNNGKWLEFDNFLEIIDLTEANCKGSSGGKPLKWAIPYRSEDIDKLQGDDENQWKKCLVRLDPPDCLQAPYSRSNHLGNGEKVQALNYKWAIPHFPSGEKQRCVLRIRYNISTNDYDPQNTFASSNNQESVIAQDPKVNVRGIPLQLAINTAQFGRTFQDRTHVFEILPRESNFETQTIHNLNVRGKRGNIVQVYPAVEYDFSPKRLEMQSTDLVHIQWDGSNKNPKNNAGEGKAGTDRTNMVEMESPDKSYPITDGFPMFNKATVIHSLQALPQTGDDLGTAMATAGYFTKSSDVPDPFEPLPGCKNDDASKLDCYAPSFMGYLLQFQPGTYYYMCTRNNNFTNRSQKGRLTVNA